MTPPPHAHPLLVVVAIAWAVFVLGPLIWAVVMEMPAWTRRRPPDPGEVEPTTTGKESTDA